MCYCTPEIRTIQCDRPGCGSTAPKTDSLADVVRLIGIGTLENDTVFIDRAYAMLGRIVGKPKQEIFSRDNWDKTNVV